jgi:hypothetical protein
MGGIVRSVGVVDVAMILVLTLLREGIGIPSAILRGDPVTLEATIRQESQKIARSRGWEWENRESGRVLGVHVPSATHCTRAVQGRKKSKVVQDKKQPVAMPDPSLLSAVTIVVNENPASWAGWCLPLAMMNLDILGHHACFCPYSREKGTNGTGL